MQRAQPPIVRTRMLSRTTMINLRGISIAFIRGISIAFILTSIGSEVETWERLQVSLIL